MHSHFKSKFGHEVNVLVTQKSLAAGWNMIAFTATGPKKMVCKTYSRRTQAGPSRRVKEQLEGKNQKTRKLR